MSESLSNFDEEQGWQIGATLQRFKAFKFNANFEAKSFLIKLIDIRTPRQIHMQVSPSSIENDVNVMLAYEPVMEKEVRKILLEIEEIYQEFFE